MKCFRYGTRLGAFYKPTNKVRANTKDARAIMEEFIALSGQKLEMFPQDMITATINSIKYGMELVELEIGKSMVHYKGKYSGGTDFEYIVMDN